MISLSKVKTTGNISSENYWPTRWQNAVGVYSYYDGDGGESDGKND